MKKILVSCLALVLVAVMVVSCNKNSPKEVANIWLTSFWQTDYETAKKYSTEETKTFIATLESLSKILPDSTKKDMKKVTVTIKEVKEDGDKATVTYQTSTEAGKDQQLKMVKQNGKWLAQFSKADQMGDVMSGMGADQAAEGDSTGTSPVPADGTSDTPADTTKH